MIALKLLREYGNLIGSYYGDDIVHLPGSERVDHSKWQTMMWRA